MAASRIRTAADRLALPQVTLCAVASVNVQATLRALEACLEQIAFADCLFFTDAAVTQGHAEIRVAPIARIRSSPEYSDFLLSGVADHIATTHCLIVQWDGHVLDARRWRPDFLDYDYIGATWPQFEDGHDVGNGGFSLRSRRLMLACQDAGFRPSHPEDLAVCRRNRGWLESRGMRFAPAALADLFSAERAGDVDMTFGYHGIFNMPKAIGVDAFWDAYAGLDDRATIRHDLFSLMRDVARGPAGLRRAARILIDYAHARRAGRHDNQLSFAANGIVEATKRKAPPS